jgi:hypothetical protein
MSKNKEVVVSVSVSADFLVKLISGNVKGCALVLNGQSMSSTQESKPKIYDESTCESIKSNAALDKALDELRGSGMIKRVQDKFSCDYGVASTLVSAHAAAKKAKRETLLVVPAKAEAIKAIVSGLEKPKATLIKTSK